MGQSIWNCKNEKSASLFLICFTRHRTHGDPRTAPIRHYCLIVDQTKFRSSINVNALYTNAQTCPFHPDLVWIQNISFMHIQYQMFSYIYIGMSIWISLMSIRFCDFFLYRRCILIMLLWSWLHGVCSVRWLSFLPSRWVRYVFHWNRSYCDCVGEGDAFLWPDIHCFSSIPLPRFAIYVLNNDTHYGSVEYLKGMWK